MEAAPGPHDQEAAVKKEGEDQVNLTTLESVIRLLAVNLEEMDADTQAQLEAKIAEVSARAVSFCNRTFEREERVCYHDGGGRYLYLNELPVQESPRSSTPFPGNGIQPSFTAPPTMPCSTRKPAWWGSSGAYGRPGDKALRVNLHRRL